MMVMAERKNNNNVTNNGDHEGGIKLFGATILLQSKREVKEDEEEDQAVNKSPEKKPADQKIIPCPRCKSMDTKFCYFNNYNVNQPRHFCKACQRYWTAGGALRNVPIGAGRRKTKPPCRSFGALPETCVFDSSGTTMLAVQPFELEGMVDQWHDVVAAAQGGFRQILPVKRRRDCQDGQTC